MCSDYYSKVNAHQYFVVMNLGETNFPVFPVFCSFTLFNPLFKKLAALCLKLSTMSVRSPSVNKSKNLRFLLFQYIFKQLR